MPPPLNEDASENGSHTHSESVASEPFQRPAWTSVCGIQPLPGDGNGSSEKIPVRVSRPHARDASEACQQGGRTGVRNPFTRKRLRLPTWRCGRPVRQRVHRPATRALCSSAIPKARQGRWGWATPILVAYRRGGELWGGPARGL